MLNLHSHGGGNIDHEAHDEQDKESQVTIALKMTVIIGSMYLKMNYSKICLQIEKNLVQNFAIFLSHTLFLAF